MSISFYKSHQPSRRAAEEIKKHSSRPQPVGKAMDRAVHFRLFVSLQMVQQVVEQGQWNRVNTSTHKAVTQV